MRLERQRLVAPLQRLGRLILCRQCLRDLPFTVSRGIRIGCELLHKIFVKLDPFAGIGFTADLLQSEVLRRARLDDDGCDLSRRQCDAKNTGQSARHHPHIPSAEKRNKHPLMRASYIRFALESNIFAGPRMAPGAWILEVKFQTAAHGSRRSKLDGNLFALFGDLIATV